MFINDFEDNGYVIYFLWLQQREQWRENPLPLQKPRLKGTSGMGIKSSRQINKPFATVERTKDWTQKRVRAGQERAAWQTTAFPCLISGWREGSSGPAGVEDLLTLGLRVCEQEEKAGLSGP